MTKHPKLTKSLALLCSASGALLLLSEMSCSKRGVCEEVVGSCLALRVEGEGPYDTLRTTLSLTGAAVDKRSGDTTADEPLGLELPVTLRIVPPSDVSAGQVNAVAVAGLRSDVEHARAASDASFVWPEGAHIDLTLQLATDDPPDGGSGDMLGEEDMRPPGDLAMPPTDLKWRIEPTTPKVNLYGVWAGSSAQAYAVGEAGTVLSRGGDGMWRSDTSGTTVTLNGVTGLAGSSVFSVGDVPGAWRRDSMKWNLDSSGLSLPAGGTLYAVAKGATAGELWAGDRDGKVWHRTGSATAAGTWGTAEQALPAGTAVYGVSSAGGAVFAVGAAGWVSVRKDSMPGTMWTRSQFSAGPVGIPTWNGVWAFDKSTAVVVGSSGLLARYSGGAWGPAPQTVNNQGIDLFAVWGLDSSRVWTAGADGLIVRVEGAKSTELARNNMQRLYGIHGLSEIDIYIVGSSTGNSSLILHGTP